ncbi:ferrous iron transport protein A [Methanoculleus sp. Wushi-C6]|uniref:Ferrous iron transport protein A n=1 Tax=Methanoculleus caldifontis TaxID=2651577 RepID=A0ABU3WXY2_9EURY|nr:FeoA family protein [Methanoculleus sp. Wushi-C6]MDV2480664.1 ferrous iron transport protein A [Methanoculleus sp. Wushi-C6]
MAGVCPLALLAPGTGGAVAEVRAGRGMQARLFGMGFCPDARVTVRSADRGSIIVSVGDARYALSKGAAMKILVRCNGEAAS